MPDNRIKYKKIFEQFYTAHYFKVKYFASQYINDEQEAENIAQEVFVSFGENIEKIDLDRNILAYLFTSAKNKALNWLSRDSYRQKYNNDVNVLYRQSINQRLLGDDVTSDILKKDIEKILTEAFSVMPEPVKETFVICKLQGFKQREAAEKLGVSEKTVEHRIKQAMLILRRRFGRYMIFLFLFFNSELYI